MSDPNALPTMNVVKDGVRQRVESGSQWEPKIGYSRAVRVGSHIAVTGTVGVLLDGTYPESAGDQARRSLQIIEGALNKLGAKLSDVVRTRMFVADISQWQEIGAAHAEFFGDIRPATSIIEIAKLIDDEALLEIEADAIVAG